MTPCYYCEADGAACKTCIHSDTYIDPQEEITKLREQVAAQASEIESLRISYDAACMLAAQIHEAAMGEVIGPYHGVVEDVRTKVAAQEAVIESNKEVFEYLLNQLGDIKDIKIVKAALAIPTDSTQILDEVRRAEREKVIEKCVELGAIERDGVFAEEIRAME